MTAVDKIEFWLVVGLGAVTIALAMVVMAALMGAVS